MEQTDRIKSANIILHINQLKLTFKVISAPYWIFVEIQLTILKPGKYFIW